MGLGVENSVNSYNQNYRYQQNKTTGQANHLDFNKILSAKEGANTEKVQKPNENSVSKVDTYTEYLKAKSKMLEVIKRVWIHWGRGHMG